MKRTCGVVALLWAFVLVPDAMALDRSTVDRADDVSGKQIHVVYAIPSDAGWDRGLDTDATLAASVASFNDWLATKADGRNLRLDTSGGELDISFIELSETNSQIRARDPFIRDFIEDELHAAGFNDPDKIYAAYYDGESDWSCGGGAWPPALPGDTAALYLHGLPDEDVPCDTNPIAGPNAPEYIEFAMLHEIMHTLGFVDVDAPNHHRDGHVDDEPNDLMWAGDGFWVPGGWDAVVLDAGNDDYYKHSAPTALDFDDSPFLTGSGGCVTWTAGVNGSWDDDASWSSGSAPTDTDDVCLTAAGTYTITVAGAREAKSVTVSASGATLNIAAGGALTVSGAFVQTAGRTIVDDTLQLAALTLDGGQLAGDGTVIGDVTNTGGTVAPGASPGTLSVTGNYTQGSTGKLLIELNGTSAGQFDVLAVSGSAALGGTFEADWNYTPAVNHQFVFMTYGSKSGKFKKSLNLFPGPGLGSKLTVGATSAKLQVVDATDVKVDKSAPSSATVGRQITYSIQVTNLGPKTAKNVKVTDKLPASTSYVSSSAQCSFAAGKATCALGDLASGASVTVTITVTVNQAGNVKNTASVSNKVLDSNANNNKDTATTAVS